MDISRFGSMYIQLTQGHFTPGQQVNGVLNVNLMQAVLGANQIYLVLAGVENVSLNERHTRYTYHGAGSSRRKKKHYKNIRQIESNPICNQKFPVYQFPGSGMPPGMYTFPFTFVLAADLPSSFSFKFANPSNSKQAHAQCSASVEYYLMAFIDDNNPNTPPIKYVQNVAVNQAQVENLGVQKCNVKKANNCCCCFSKGTTSITTYFEKNEYCPGETACVLTEIDNSQSSDAVTSVTVAFTQSCTFRANAYTHRYVINHQKATINGAQGGMNLPAQRMEVRLVAEDGQFVTPTCRGRLVKNEYVLYNRAHVDTTCNCDVSHTESTMFLTIRNPDMVYNQWVQPQNWHPQAMPMAQLQMGQKLDQKTFPPELMLKAPANNTPYEEDGSSEEDPEAEAGGDSD